MITYTESSNISIINYYIWKSLAFLHTNNYQKQKAGKKSCSKTTQKRTKCIDLNLTKKVKELYSKAFMKEI